VKGHVIQFEFRAFGDKNRAAKIERDAFKLDVSRDAEGAVLLVAFVSADDGAIAEVRQILLATCR
jgi:hypothetical protein